MKTLTKLAQVVIVLALIILIIGCGGSPSKPGSTTANPQNKPLDPQGNWLLSFTNSGAFINGNTAFLIAGQLYELNPPVVTSNPMGEVLLANTNPVCTGSFTFNGQASGTNTINLTGAQVNAPGNLGKMSLTGTIATDQAHMSGTWNVSTPGDCLRIGDQGTWTAQLLAPVTGNWSGTMSNGGTTLIVTAALTENIDQTTQTMGQVTGTITVLGSPCFASADALTIAPWDGQKSPGIHGGETLILTSSPDANGVSVDTAGTVAPDGSNFAAGFGFRVHGGACDGQQFSGSLAHQ